MPSQTREIQHVLIATVKQAAAALREANIEFMRSRSCNSPFARAFFTLVKKLGIVESDRSVAA